MWILRWKIKRWAREGIEGSILELQKFIIVLYLFGSSSMCFDAYGYVCRSAPVEFPKPELSTQAYFSSTSPNFILGRRKPTHYQNTSPIRQGRHESKSSLLINEISREYLKDNVKRACCSTAVLLMRSLSMTDLPLPSFLLKLIDAKQLYHQRLLPHHSSLDSIRLYPDMQAGQ